MLQPVVLCRNDQRVHCRETARCQQRCVWTWWHAVAVVQTYTPSRHVEATEVSHTGLSECESRQLPVKSVSATHGSHRQWHSTQCLRVGDKARPLHDHRLMTGPRPLPPSLHAHTDIQHSKTNTTISAHRRQTNKKKQHKDGDGWQGETSHSQSGPAKLVVVTRGTSMTKQHKTLLSPARHLLAL